MPNYTFSNPKTLETKEIFFGMNEKKEYVDSSGLKWERLFSNPQISLDTKISATDSKDFVRKTRDKNYSIGDLWSKSEELSIQREGASGVDEIRIKAESDYEKKTGKKHPQAKKQSKIII